MALIETLNQLREAYEAIAGSADRAEKAAARMEQHEQRTADLVDRAEALFEGIKNLAHQQQREAVRTRAQRILDVLVGGLFAAAILALLGFL